MRILGRRRNAKDSHPPPAATAGSPPSNHHSQPINASRLNRHLVLLAVTLLHRFRPRSGRVIFLTSNYCIKHGPFLHLNEAAAMKVVAERTTVPVPKVYCAFERKGSTYILMERIDGKMIADRWIRRSEQSQAALLAQLRGYIAQLRALASPRSGVIAAADLSKLFDYRIPSARAGFGPFSSVEEFHLSLREGLSGDNVMDESSLLKNLVRMHDSREYSVCFTHGDLSPLNILVRNERIVGIIDWEMAGWFPDYWEYTSASNVHPFLAYWKDEVGKFVPPFDKEVEMEELRRKLFGDF